LPRAAFGGMTIMSRLFEVKLRTSWPALSRISAAATAAVI